MAYMWRGRGPRTRGGHQREINPGISSNRYGRSDCNMFSCLSDRRGMPGDSENPNSSDSDTDALFSDNAKSSEGGFQTVQSKKKRKFNSSSGAGSMLHAESGVDVPDYDILNNDEKINLILSKVTLYEARFQNLENVFGSVKKQKKRLSQVETVIKSYDDRIRLLEYKTIDLEARSRRNNILFFGVNESRNENCKATVMRFLRDHLDITINEEDINRAHRVRRYDSRKKRPLIAGFQSYSLVESVMKEGHLLKETDLSISRDYPLEITRARKTLWPEYKRVKTQNPLAKVSIAFPAKIVVDGVVTLDLFPEWDDIIYGSRIDIRHPSQESFARKQRNAPFRGFGGFGVPQSTPIHATSSTRNRDGHDSGSPRDMETDAAVVDINESRSESVNDAAKEVTRAQPTSDTNPGGACGTAADFKTPNTVTNTKQQHERSSGTGSRASSRSRSRSRSRSVSLSRPIGGENPTAQHQDPNTTDG